MNLSRNFKILLFLVTLIIIFYSLLLLHNTDIDEIWWFSLTIKAKKGENGKYKDISWTLTTIITCGHKHKYLEGTLASALHPFNKTITMASPLVPITSLVTGV